MMKKSQTLCEVEPRKMGNCLQVFPRTNYTPESMLVLPDSDSTTEENENLNSRGQEIAKLPINICRDGQLSSVVIKNIHSSQTDISKDLNNIDQISPAATKNDHFSQEELSENICHINILPLEVLDIIFKFSRNNKSVRRVCKSWYSVCNYNVKLNFNERHNLESASPYLEKCELDRVKVRFSKCVMSRLSTDAWRKFGRKITSLEFQYCELGDTVMENMISNCDNLRVLRIIRQYWEPAITICSPLALERLNIEQKTLNTFYIGNFGPSGSTFEFWERFYRALFKIFPNIVNLETYFNLLLGRFPKFEFSTELRCYDNELVPGLALWHSSVASEDWEAAFRALSGIRLKSLLLHVKDLDLRELSFLGNFFTQQRSLQSVNIQGMSRIRSEVGQPLLAHILNIPELRKLRIYNADRPLYELSDDLPFLFSKIPKLESFNVTPVKCTPTSAFFEHAVIERDSFFLTFIPKFTYLEHLNFENRVKDGVLQCIFKYMTNLKSLRICIDTHDLTNTALVGRCRGENLYDPRTKYRYSIKRLKNLEELCIYTNTTWYPGRISDEIYDEFQFPKLRYLCCFSPKEPSTFAKTASNLPSLTKLHLAFKEVSLSYLEQLVQFTPKLQTLHFYRYGKGTLIGEESIYAELQKIFIACPSLRCLRTRYEKCELFPDEIRCRESYQDLGKCHPRS